MAVYVSSGILYIVCQLLIGHRLQVGFSANAMTYLTQEVSADLIMVDRWKSSPPRGQFRACSTVHCPPQMQWEGRCDGRQPYRRHSASLKAPLWRANPCSSMGKVESQLQAPFRLQIRSRPSGKLVLELRGSCCFLLSAKSARILPGSALLGLGLRRICM